MICNTCNQSIPWDQEYHSKTGKWRAVLHKDKEGYMCAGCKTTGKDYIQCKYCTGQWGWFLKIEKDVLAKHIKTYHADVLVR